MERRRRTIFRENHTRRTVLTIQVVPIGAEIENGGVFGPSSGSGNVAEREHNRQYHCDERVFQKEDGERERERERIANGEEEMEKRQPTRATKYNVANEQKEGPGSEFGSRDNLAKEVALRRKIMKAPAMPPWIEVSTDRTYLVKPTDVGHVLKLEIQPCDAKAPAPNERGGGGGVVTRR